MASATRAVARRAAWTQPRGRDTRLMLWNSLTRSKVPLCFGSERATSLSWYQCGPTVYEAAHLGHARTYVGLDVLQRVLTDYLAVPMTRVMNITDVDDKIIARAEETGVPFQELAQRCEASFFADMERLGVQRPDILTRVSQYVPEVIAFVTDLVQQNKAYVTATGVYFDVAAHGDRYGKLRLPAGTTHESVSASLGAESKRSPRDFALWKAEPQPELRPSWPSPWGAGRPGWHIECSAMCTSVFGAELDIHAGGIDLAFPHHENEVAQCEARFQSSQWANYFVHTGHLSIQGRKMAKSLKNFITIDEMLEKCSRDAFRVFVLSSHYRSPVEYSEQSLGNAAETVSRFVNFQAACREHVRRRATSTDPVSRADLQRLAQLAEMKHDVDAALLDDFDTPRVLATLRRITDLVLPGIAAGDASVDLVQASLQYLQRILRVFGVAALQQDAAGFGQSATAAVEAAPSAELLDRVLQPCLDLRHRVRTHALSSKPRNVALLQACDQHRSEMAEAGIALDDGKDGTRWKPIVR